MDRNADHEFWYFTPSDKITCSHVTAWGNCDKCFMQSEDNLCVVGTCYHVDDTYVDQQANFYACVDRKVAKKLEQELHTEAYTPDLVTQ